MNSSNPLVDWLLDSLEVDTSLFHVGRYCGGWHASTHGLARASFHLVVQGHCWAHVAGSARGWRLDSGDALFFLRDVEFRLSSEATAEAARCQPRGEMQALEWNAADGAGLVCGFFHFHSGLSGLIVDALPDWLILRAGDPALDAARRLFALIVDECRRQPAPSPVLLERLSHLLFLYVLRQQVLDNPTLGGLVALARQPQFAGLLEALIEAPEQPWSLEQMAERTGLSRSAFFKRFNELSGQSPGQVLLALRMHRACALLRADASVAEVAAAVGYQSTAAFTRAFHKATGQQPGPIARPAADQRRPIGTEQANGAEAGSKSARLVKRPVRNGNPEHATPRPWGGWRRTAPRPLPAPAQPRRFGLGCAFVPPVGPRPCPEPAKSPIRPTS